MHAVTFTFLWKVPHCKSRHLKVLCTIRRKQTSKLTWHYKIPPFFSRFSKTVRPLIFARRGSVKRLCKILNPLVKWQSVASFDDKVGSFNRRTRAALKEEPRAAVRDFHRRSGASADCAHDTPQVSALAICLSTKLLKAVRKSDWSTGVLESIVLYTLWGVGADLLFSCAFHFAGWKCVKNHQTLHLACRVMQENRSNVLMSFKTRLPH